MPFRGSYRPRPAARRVCDRLGRPLASAFGCVSCSNASRYLRTADASVRPSARRRRHHDRRTGRAPDHPFRARQKGRNGKYVCACVWGGCCTRAGASARPSPTVAIARSVSAWGTITSAAGSQSGSDAADRSGRACSAGQRCRVAGAGQCTPRPHPWLAPHAYQPAKTRMQWFWSERGRSFLGREHSTLPERLRGQ